MSGPAVRTLSIHSSYRCADSGACCTANWPIPIEADRLAAARAALASGRLAPAGHVTAPFESPADAPDNAPALVATSGGACVFYDASAARHCRIQTALGHESLPLACRQFPRVSLHDPRGTSVTLSHYCPTAAALLTRPSVVNVDVDAPGFRGGQFVGLDAGTGLPPLLKPDLLMDWESWWTWERKSLAMIDATAGPPGVVLGRLGAVVESVRSWRPGDGPLIVAVERAFSAAASSPRPRPDQGTLLDGVLDAIPVDWQPAVLARDVTTPDEVARRFLAAHAFANWTAHLGGGLRSWLRSIETAAALLELGLGVRQTDLLLRHLAEPERLAEGWSEVERS